MHKQHLLTQSQFAKVFFHGTHLNAHFSDIKDKLLSPLSHDEIRVLTVEQPIASHLDYSGDRKNMSLLDRILNALDWEVNSQVGNNSELAAEIFLNDIEVMTSVKNPVLLKKIMNSASEKWKGLDLILFRKESFFPGPRQFFIRSLIT